VTITPGNRGGTSFSNRELPTTTLRGLPGRQGAWGSSIAISIAGSSASRGRSGWPMAEPRTRPLLSTTMATKGRTGWPSSPGTVAGMAVKPISQTSAPEG